MKMIGQRLKRIEGDIGLDGGRERGEMVLRNVFTGLSSELLPKEQRATSRVPVTCRNYCVTSHPKTSSGQCSLA